MSETKVSLHFPTSFMIRPYSIIYFSPISKELKDLECFGFWKMARLYLKCHVFVH